MPMSWILPIGEGGIFLGGRIKNMGKKSDKAIIN